MKYACLYCDLHIYQTNAIHNCLHFLSPSLSLLMCLSCECSYYLLAIVVDSFSLFLEQLRLGNCLEMCNCTICLSPTCDSRILLFFKKKHPTTEICKYNP